MIPQYIAHRNHLSRRSTQLRDSLALFFGLSHRLFQKNVPPGIQRFYGQFVVTGVRSSDDAGIRIQP